MKFAHFLIGLLSMGTLLAAPGLPISISCLHYAEKLQNIALRTGPRDFTKVELSTANIVGPLNAVIVKGGITFYEDAPPGAKGLPPVVALAKIPPGLKEPLIIFLPSTDPDTLPYRTVVVNKSAKKLPLGSYQCINLTATPLRATIGDTNEEIAAGESTLLSPKGKPGEMISASFSYQQGELWRKAFETRWAIRRDRRAIVCAYLDPRTKRMKVRSIPLRTK